METHVRAPDPLCKSGNITCNWYKWKENFNIFMKMSGCEKASNDIKINILKAQIGSVGVEAINNLSFNHPKDKNNLDVLMAKLDLYFDPAKNEVIQHYNFFNRSKGNNESIEDFIADLKEKAKTCNFGSLTDTLIRDKMILSVKDKVLRKTLFNANNCDLPNLIKIYKEHETNVKETIQKTSTNNEYNNPKKDGDLVKIQIENKQYSASVPNKKPCWRCGKRHLMKQCPAWGKRCDKCGELHHLTMCCRSDDIKNTERETNTYKPPGNMSKNILQQGVDASKTVKINNLMQRSGADQCFRVSSVPSSTPNSSIPAPSAPPFSEAENKLYPNLNYMNLPKGQTFPESKAAYSGGVERNLPSQQTGSKSVPSSAPFNTAAKQTETTSTDESCVVS